MTVNKKIIIILTIISAFISKNTYAVKDLELDIHAIGQGNFVTIKVPSSTNDQYEYMIVDMGTSSYNSERNIFKKWREKPIENIENLPLPSQNTSSPHTTTHKIKSPSSLQKGSSTYQDRKEGSKNQKNVSISGRNKFIRWLYSDKINPAESLNDQLEFLRLEQKVIKTIVITHPDADHCNLLEHIVGDESLELDIQVKYLILGGLPKRYLEKQKFGTILEKLTQRGTNVYFAATSQTYGTNNFNKIEEYAPPFYFIHERSIKPSKEEEKAEEVLSKTKKMEEFFKEAFNFENEKFKVHCLCANALHVNGKSGKVLRLQGLLVLHNKLESPPRESCA